MKKDELGLSAMIAAIICIVLSLVLFLGNGSEGNVISIDNPYAQTVADNTAAPTPATTAPTAATTQAPTTRPTNAPDLTQAASATAVAGETVTEAPSADSLPVTPAEILAKYTQVMDKAKSEGPAHN